MNENRYRINGIANTVISIGVIVADILPWLLFVGCVCVQELDFVSKNMNDNIILIGIVTCCIFIGIGVVSFQFVLFKLFYSFLAFAFFIAGCVCIKKKNEKVLFAFSIVQAVFMLFCLMIYLLQCLMNATICLVGVLILFCIALPLATNIIPYLIWTIGIICVFGLLFLVSTIVVAIPLVQQIRLIVSAYKSNHPKQTIS